MSDIDLSAFPQIEIPSNLTAEDSLAPQPLGVQLMSFPFCLSFLGRPWQTLIVAAPSPPAAAFTMDQFVKVVNVTLERMGYPANSCSSTIGACS